MNPPDIATFEAYAEVTRSSVYAALVPVADIFMISTLGDICTFHEVRPNAGLFCSPPICQTESPD